MYKFLAAAVLLSLPFAAQAGVTVGATRVIYDGEKKEESVNLYNDEKIPSLVQSWVEDKNGAASSAFIITPPLFKLEPERESKVRIMLTRADLPQDRESLFFLNVKSIPGRTKSDNNRLNIAINNRMKLLYRPAPLSLAGAQDAYRKLQPTQAGNRLSLYNPTPYVLSLYQIYIGDQLVQKTVTVEPFATTNITLSGQPTGKTTWQAIGDFGNVLEKVIR